MRDKISWKFFVIMLLLLALFTWLGADSKETIEHCMKHNDYSYDTCFKLVHG